MEFSTRPKVGLALSGASVRAIFYIGLIEALGESGIPIDFIAACSSGSLVAASYACGTFKELKEFLFSADKNTIFSLFDKCKTQAGHYNLDRAEEFFRQFTKNLRFEDVRPGLAFLATDLEAGERVVLSMGDIAHAARVSCTVPGLFEPTVWGNKVLVDGGLLSVVPAYVARDAGMDVVIGVHMRTQQFIFGTNQIILKHAFYALSKLLMLEHTERIWNRIKFFLEGSGFLSYYSEFHELDSFSPYVPNLFSVLGKSLDIALRSEKLKVEHSEIKACDILIRPATARFTKSDPSKVIDLYELGRKVGMQKAGSIKKIIKEKQQKLVVAL